MDKLEKTPIEIMSEATRQGLCDVLLNIDQVHCEKQRRLGENRRLLAEFVAGLADFAAEFTRLMGRPEFRMTVAPEGQHPDRHQFTVNRLEAVLAVVTISGTASSHGVHVSEVELEVGKLSPIQPFAEIHQRLSELLVRRIESAGREFNKF